MIGGDDASNRLLDLDTLSIRQLVYQLAKANDISCPDSWETRKRAGNDCFRNSYTEIQPFIAQTKTDQHIKSLSIQRNDGW